MPTTSAGRLEVEGLGKRFGAVMAVADVGIDVAAGEFLTILGPSGSGKTTLLKLIAGFEMPDSGAIRIDGDDVSGLDPARRNIGMVFQNYALFPHLTVARNVAYPLVMRKVSKPEISRRVAEALALVELAQLGERRPNQLSGGQQQRVALARAVVFRPRLLLLDEPFGALDRKLREQMQLEVRRLQRRLGLTTIFITHDQEEALIMSDRVAVMDRGAVQQIGRPQDIYEAPANAFVAGFVGESNFLEGTIVTDGATDKLRLASGSEIAITRRSAGAGVSGRRATVMIRPERFLDLANADAAAPVNRLACAVEETIYTGTDHRYRVRTQDGIELLLRLPSGARRRRYLPGEAIEVGFSAADAVVIKAG